MSSLSDQIPLAPRRYPFFYGWVVVVLGTLGFMMSAPGQTHGVAPFTDHLMEALGLTRVQLSTAYMFGTLCSGLLLTFAGKLYDRIGARVMAPAACLVLGSVLVVMSRCDAVVDVLQGEVGGTSWKIPFAVALVCFFVLRFSGQGILTMVSRNMVMKWFDHYRGMVTGVSGMVMGPFFAATPMLLNSLVTAVGWRQAWVMLAVIIGIGFSSLAALFYRDDPVPCGLKPDGPLGAKRPSTGGDAQRVQFTLKEACRTYSLWVFVVSLALFGLYLTGLSFHVASIFESAGLERARGFAVFLPGAVVTIALRPFIGWLADRIPLKYLLMFMLVGVAVSASGVAVLAPGRSTWIVIAGNGICGSVVGTLSAVVWPNFFGRRHLGAISGLNMSAMVIASALGPWLFGQVLATSGSYRGAALGCAACSLVLIVAAAKANSPQVGSTEPGA